MTLRWIIAILLLTASLGQLNRLFIGDTNDLVFYFNDLLVGVAAVWYVATAIIARKSWIIPPAMLPLAAWFGLGLAGLLLATPLLSTSELMVSWSYWLRYAAYVLVFFFVAYDSLVYAMTAEQRRTRLRWWIIIVLVSGLLMAIGGFIQLYILPDLSELAKYGWDPHIDRLVTAMLDPNYAGCYFSIVIGVAVSLFLHLREHYGLRLLLLALTSILLAALLLTYSRSGYIMLAIILGSIAVVKSRVLLVVGLVLALVTILAVPRIQMRIAGAFTVDASAQPRIISWQNSWRIAQDNLFLGVGFNSYRYAQDRYGIVNLDKSGNAGAGADSSWLFTLATTGILGLLAYVFNYLALLWLSAKLYVSAIDPVAKSLALSVAAILAGLALASQFNNSLYYTWILELVWLLCGLVMAMVTVSEDADRRPVDD